MHPTYRFPQPPPFGKPSCYILKCNFAKYTYFNYIITFLCKINQVQEHKNEKKSPGMREMNNIHGVMGFSQQSPPLHLQYLQQWIPATRQTQLFLCAHLHGSGRPSGFEITISGTNNLSLLV